MAYTNAEKRRIARRTNAWAFKIAGKSCYVVFHKLSGNFLARCWPGIVKIPAIGMRSFQRNVICLDLDKIEKGGYDLESTIIHEATHLKPELRKNKDPHSNAFACEMKKHIGRHEWGKATEKRRKD